jgi:arylsulfatase A-like enzyme
MSHSNLRRRDFLALGAAGLAGALAPRLLAGEQTTRTAATTLPARAHGRRKPNVLLIILDDLRPMLGCYGQKQVHSPNIDALAAHGTQLEHAYCQYPVCNPSRLSLFTGLSPSHTRVFDNNTVWPRQVSSPSLPAHFRTQGYATLSVGKVYHQPTLTDLAAFTEKPQCLNTHNYLLPANQQRIQEIYAEAKAKGTPWEQYGGKLLVAATEDAPVDDDAYDEGRHTLMALDVLNRYRDQRFFLALGHFRPHMPYVAPRKYWDLYDPAKLKLSDNQAPVKQGLPYPLHDNFEPKCYGDIPKVEHFDEAVQRRLLHGYYASISYVDALVGRVLRRLEELGLAQDTVVALIGDNGYLLGEHNLWGKFTTFENAARCPLILRGPGIAAGNKSSTLAELIDLYPTFCDLASLPCPPHVDGTSLLPALRGERPGKEAAFTQFLKGDDMGFTLRTPRHRYTEWINQKNQRLLGCELYDYTLQPEEGTNLAGEAEQAKLCARLSGLLRSHFAYTPAAA